jgi:hypothetical protein
MMRLFLTSLLDGATGADNSPGPWSVRITTARDGDNGVDTNPPSPRGDVHQFC